MHIQNGFSARNLIRLFLAFLISAVFVYGQNPTPTPDSETIRVNTDLIQTNVTVFDKSGRFVDDLKKDQFELRVDGKPVPVEFFERYVSAETIENTNSQNNPQKPNLAGASSKFRGRKIIFFIDDLHLSLDSLERTRSTISYFIEKEIMPRDNVLIVSASGQIGFLQQFTDNKAVLRAAVARLKYIPFIARDSEPPPMPEFTALRIVNGDREVADYYVEQIFKGFNVKGARGINYAGALEMVKNRANNIVNNLVVVSESSLGSLENLLQILSRNSDRKLIFFASDGFFLGAKNNSPVDNTKLQRVIDLATRSGSAIYTIDARGLFSLEADATGERPVDPIGRFDRGKVSEAMLSQEALFALAEQTGGKFLKNQNYFEKWVDKTLEENANYYVLAWSPEKDLSGDRNFRRIEISVTGRPDLNVRMQRGFLSGVEKNTKKNKENKKQNADNKTSENAAPIIVQEKSVKKSLPLVLSLNYVDVPSVGAVLNSSVQVETDELDYGSNQSATMDIAGVVFNDQGKQIADFKTGLSVSPVQTNNEQSVIYNARTPLAPGIYQVKVGARERKSGQTGTAAQWIEIPDLTDRQLTLGSILLGVKTIKKSDKPGDVQTQFSVDHQFARPLNLNFMSFIYNATKGASGEMNLMSKIEIFDAQGQIVVETPMRSLSTKGMDDLARIPFTGAIKQQTSLPGDYLLRVTVNDSISNKTAVQETIFTVK